LESLAAFIAGAAAIGRKPAATDAGNNSGAPMRRCLKLI